MNLISRFDTLKADLTQTSVKRQLHEQVCDHFKPDAGVRLLGKHTSEGSTRDVNIFFGVEIHKCEAQQTGSELSPLAGGRESDHCE